MTWSDARQRWEWTGNFSAGALQFKFASGPGWGGSNYGTGAGVAASTAATNGPDNLSTNLVAGRYRFAFTETNGAFSVQNLPVSTEWRENAGLPLSGAWTNDTDGDGASDLQEYAMGGNPTNRVDGISLQTMATTNHAGTNRLVLQWLERTDGGSSLVVTPQISTNIAAGWAPVESSNVASRLGDPLNHQRKEVSVPVGEGAKFLRLRVTGP